MKKKVIFQFLILSIFCFITFQLAAQHKFPDFPPKDVTREMDRAQMLFQMGITVPELPSKLEDPNALADAFPRDSLNPQNNWTDEYGHTITRSGWGLWNNYHDRSAGLFPGSDSIRLGNYTPINLLKMNSGEMISTEKDWFEKRRPEILHDLQEHLYGFFPPKDKQPGITFSVKTTTSGKGNSAYIEKQITGEIDISAYNEVRDKPVISATLRTPVAATGPVPVMMIFGGFGNSTDRYWNIAAPNGWGVCTFNPNAIQPDNGTGLTSFLIGLVNKGNWRKPDDWGSITAWSWGISRLIDYLETDENVNATALGLTGHSRYGKATLVSAAFEPRIAIAFPSDAGSLGTKMSRRHWGQDLENSAGASEYHWMAGNFFNWVGELVPGQYLPRKIEECPVDAHSLVALCAPRPVLINGGTRSSWTDPYGMYLTQVNATPVYELLGKKGIVMKDKKPQIDKGYIEGDLAYRYHDGGHTDAPEWPTFFEFASRYIDATTLNSSDDFVFLPSNKSVTIIQLKSNKSWSVQNAANWLVLDKTTGKGNDSITIRANKNMNNKGRSVELLVVTDGKKLNIEVNQASENDGFQLSVNELTLSGQEQNSANFTIESNTAWQVSSTENWILIDNETGINSTEIKIHAPPNPLVEKRSASLNISTSGNNSKSIQVVQEDGEPTLRLFNRSIKVDASETTNSSVFVITNTICEVNSPEDWVTGEVSTTGRFKRLIVYIKENQTGATRSTLLKLKVKGLPDQLVEVTQESNE